MIIIVRRLRAFYKYVLEEVDSNMLIKTTKNKYLKNYKYFKRLLKSLIFNINRKYLDRFPFFTVYLSVLSHIKDINDGYY